jgi:hypothetical protein
MAVRILVAPLPVGSEEERVAEIKTRVVALLDLNSGATAADVDCGEGFLHDFPGPFSWSFGGPLAGIGRGQSE